MTSPTEIILRKRNGGRLRRDDIATVIDGVVSGAMAEYQISALLMAIYFQGMEDEELGEWTQAMLHSGEVVVHETKASCVDKHSTGGVGDKISIPLAPAVAACGAAVPMISGRGLGHTGGTLDKLESIPGFDVRLPVSDFKQLVSTLGMALIGQTDNIAPADRKLYALRDVTGTVESIPLIASSIMSKKLAEGIDALVLDCKVGRGAFMKDLNEARKLAAAITAIGQAGGKKVTVMLTEMDHPIGRYIGNSLEVLESIEVLRGEGPKDTVELTTHLGAEMLVLAGVSDNFTNGCTKISAALSDGSALDVFRKCITAQSGDAAVCDAPEEVLPIATEKVTLESPSRGWLSCIAARDAGIAALELGAGRKVASDKVDPAVGIELLARRGDQVEKGQPLATIYHNGQGVDECMKLLLAACDISSAPVAPPQSRIIEVLR